MGDLPKPGYARDMRLIGHSDQGGRGDGLQVMVHRCFAYVAHPWSGGFSIVDVRDPKNPGATTFVPAPPNTWTIHLQTHDDLLLVVHALDLFADVRFADEKAYYTGSVGEAVGGASALPAWLSTTSRGQTRRDRSASFRSTASARTASGMSAAATPMSRR